MNIRTAVLLLAIGCGGADAPAETPDAPDPAPATEEPAAEPDPEPVAEPEVATDPVMDDTARLLAGLPLDKTSPLAHLSASPEYEAYAASMTELWTMYDDKTLSKLRPWQEQHLGDAGALPVFYPFSGPDIMNAVLLFPQGTTYTLMGLEPVGTIPKWKEAQAATVKPALDQLAKSVEDMLRRNYFITTTMAERMGDDEADQGVTPVMMFMLARTGHEILGVRVIELTTDGEVVAQDDPKAAKGKLTRGVEIRFRDRAEGVKGPGPEQSVRYFPGNANDGHFTQGGGLHTYIHKQGEHLAMAKAASYLMYYHEFDDVRGLFMGQAKLILTESSGLPWHRLDDPKDWDVTLYGNYDKPIRAYVDRCQPDLKAALAKNSTAELPFPFGYQYQTGNHMMIARRAATNPLVAEPVYDASMKIGFNTTCRDGKVYEMHFKPRDQKPDVETQIWPAAG